ncbi:MAG: HD domain-containing protein [Desulfomonile tiedjei]|nr:HD domain-containing protein [Desulfomonile tiedjei]
MKCPGQDPRFWKFDAIFDAECPKCGSTLEFFKDETRRTCRKCGHKVLNPKMDFGCALHCKFAEHCFGDLPPELIQKKQDLFKDRVALEMKRYFKQDFKRIGHAAKVARYAEMLVKEEKADPAVALSAAYLHDIGIPEAERKDGNPNIAIHEEEGPAIARDILNRLDAPPDLIEEVCDIIGHHHHPTPQDTINFKVVYDSDMLVNLEDKHKNTTPTAGELEELVGAFLTAAGRNLARSVLFEGGNGTGEV